MSPEDFLKTLDERATADAQDKKHEQQTQAMVDAITLALKPFTDNPPKIQTIIPKFSKLPDITANVDHTPVIEAIKQLAVAIQSQPLPKIPTPQVHVDVPPIDVSPLKGVLKAATPQPLVITTDLATYKAQDIDEMEQGIQYVGFVNPKGEWYIIQNKEVLNQVRYKFGDSGYAEAFKTADKYEYKLLNEAISEV